MEESKLLDECITLNLTPLQTILLSKTVTVMTAVIEYLKNNDCIEIQRYTSDDLMAPASEQIGNILMQSALEAMKEVEDKIYENGKEEIGEKIPEEFYDVVGIYTILLEQVAYQFLASLHKG